MGAGVVTLARVGQFPFFEVPRPLGVLRRVKVRVFLDVPFGQSNTRRVTVTLNGAAQ